VSREPDALLEKRRTRVRRERYRRGDSGYFSFMDLESTIVLAPVALALMGELLLWLKHRRDVADPPSWN